MASELKTVLGEAGLTLTAAFYNGVTLIASGVALSEVTDGYYVGDAPALAAGTYMVLMYSSGVLKASGTLVWDGTQELNPLDQSTTLTEVHGRLGLSSTDPLESAPDRISFGAVVMDVVDMSGTIVVTRQ